MWLPGVYMNQRKIKVVRVIDEKRVLQMAKEYGMNPDKARKILEDARSEPAIMTQIHRYEQLMGGDSSGRGQDNQEAPGWVQEAEKGDTSP